MFSLDYMMKLVDFSDQCYFPLSWDVLIRYMFFHHQVQSLRYFPLSWDVLIRFSLAIIFDQTITEWLFPVILGCSH